MLRGCAASYGSSDLGDTRVAQDARFFLEKEGFSLEKDRGGEDAGDHTGSNEVPDIGKTSAYIRAKKNKGGGRARLE